MNDRSEIDMYILEGKILQLLSRIYISSMGTIRHVTGSIPYDMIESVLLKMNKDGYIEVIDGEHGKRYSLTHKGSERVKSKQDNDNSTLRITENKGD